MQDKRILKPSTIRYVNGHLYELARLRTKLGYAKIKPAKRIKLRKRVRLQLECLRKYFPKIEGVVHPCDPNTWEEKKATAKEIAEAKAALMYLTSVMDTKRGF